MITKICYWSAVSIIVGFFSAAHATAATLEVPNNYPTLRAALAAAQDGDEIVVADGVYRGQHNRNLDFKGKRITLRSENGPEQCVIDCENSGRAFHFHSGEEADSVVEGFTIQNGWMKNDHGGAMLCENAGPTIRACVFLRNTLELRLSHYHGGGAVAALGGAPQFIDCAFIENAQIGGHDNAGGGVVAAFGSRPSFLRCIFTRNHAIHGGGVAIPEGCQASFRDCLFTDNTAELVGGGLIGSKGSQAVLENCRFVGNSAKAIGGGVACRAESTMRVIECEFEGNTAASGGGLSCDRQSAVTLYGTRFRSNVVDHAGGGAYVAVDSRASVRQCEFYDNATLGSFGGGGGGGLAVGDVSDAYVVGSTFSGNSGSGDGGAMWLWNDSYLSVRNSTLVNNDAPVLNGFGLGGAVCAWGSYLRITNSIVHGNTGPHGNAFALVRFPDYPQEMEMTISSSLVQDGESGVYMEDPNDPSFVVNWSADTFDGDPLFADAHGPDGLPGTGDEDLHLMAGSPCIDAGDPTYAVQPGETDFEGDPRVVDGDGDGVAVIDIGADEFVPP